MPKAKGGKLNSKAFISAFIELYRAHTCLWQVTNKDYSNKNKRQAAIDQLVAEAKTMYPRANDTQIKAKIGSLRSTFLRELKKIEGSKRSGAAADDVYVPKLWYFNSLIFLKD